MLQQFALGSALMLVTTAIHALWTLVAIRLLRRWHASDWAAPSPIRMMSLISIVVLMMLVAAFLETSAWAAVYLGLGAIPDLETALYFSTVTFTTLGYGDVTLDASWRLLASFQAANGTIMFGWTTALVMAVLHRMVAAYEAAAAQAAP